MKSPNRFLIWMGIGLCLAHALTAWSWIFERFFVFYSADSMTASCHAFWISCLQISIPENLMLGFLGIYGVLSLVTAVLFGRRKENVAIWLLWILSLTKFFFFVLRFNVMGNYHLLHFFMLFAFLCLPQKRFSLYLTLIYLYVLAGMLKFNDEWLSGAAVVSRPFIADKWLSLALAYVLVMEVVVVWGLLSNRRWLRAATLFQLVLFHLFSWHIVGYYYPMTMLFLLLPFGIDLFSKNEKLSWKQLSPLTAAFLAISLFFQVRPYFDHRDPALTGRFRSFRINMLDARPECSALAFVQQGSTLHSLNLTSFNALRTRCDTSGFETQLYRYCMQSTPEIQIRYLLYSKRHIDPKFSIIEDSPNVCRRYRH